MLDRYNGFSGCNWFLGTYGVEGNSISLETPATTEGGYAEEGLVEQDGTYMTSLENVTEAELADGKLLLYTVEDQLLITMVPSSPYHLRERPGI